MHWANLSKFGVPIDLDIDILVLPLRPRPEVDFQIYGRHLEKSILRHNFAMSGPVWMIVCQANDKSYRKTANIIVKTLSGLSPAFPQQTRRSKMSANITKDDITSQRSDIFGDVLHKWCRLLW